MKSIQLKRIGIDDPEYPQVWALREALLRVPLGLSLRDEDLSGEKEEFIIVAMETDMVCGCVMLKPLSGDTLKLRQMAVSPAYQRQRIGEALVRDAEGCAREHGFSRITLHARKDAVPFYEHSGYRVVGEEFSEVGIPHLAMQKHLK